MLALALAGLCAGEAAAAQTAAGSRFTPELARRQTVRDTLAHVDAHFAEQVDEWIRLTAMPAPSGREAARGQYARGQLEALSLPVEADSIGNVWTVLRGTGSGPRTVFAAHLDTAHPDGTDLPARRADSTLHGPGVFDNTASMANLLAVARAWRAAGLQTRGDVVLLWTAHAPSSQRRNYLKRCNAWCRNWVRGKSRRPDRILPICFSPRHPPFSLQDIQPKGIPFAAS